VHGWAGFAGEHVCCGEGGGGRQPAVEGAAVVEEGEDAGAGGGFERSCSLELVQCCAMCLVWIRDRREGNKTYEDVPVTFSIFTWSLQNLFSLASCTL
jgi:hypothetical protein